MKHLKNAMQTILAILIAASINHSTAAQERVNTWYKVVPVTGEAAMNVVIDLESKEKVAISLTGEDGKSIWKNNYHTANLAKSFMLTELPNGTYKVGIQRDNAYAEETIYLEDSFVNVIDKEAMHVESPTLAVVNRQVIVDYAPVSAGEMVEITFLDETYSEIYAKAIKGGEHRIIRYDVSEFTPGTYHVRFLIDGQSFTRSFRIR